MIDPERRWAGRAACAGLPTEVFFLDHSGHDEGRVKSTPKREAHYAEAKTICQHCPVLAECRRDTVGEPYGVWGGLDPGERRKIRRRASFESTNWGAQRKRRVGHAITVLRKRQVPWHDIERLYGLNLRAVQSLYEWYRIDQAETAGTVYLPGDKPKRRSQVNVTDAERRAILNLVRAHVSQKEIAKRLNRAPATISKVLRDLRTQSEETMSAA